MSFHFLLPALALQVQCAKDLPPLTQAVLLHQVVRHYQTLGNPLSKRSSLNGLHSHFLLVDDGTLGKSGGQLELRRRLERHIHRQRIHPSECGLWAVLGKEAKV